MRSFKQCSMLLLVMLLVTGHASTRTAHAVEEYGYNAPRIPLVAMLRQDIEDKNIRSALDYVTILRRYPARRIDITLKTASETKAMVQDIKALAAQQGVNIQNRLCFTARIDVVKKYRTDYAKCQPGVGGDGCDWEPSFMNGYYREPENVTKTSHLDNGYGQLKSNRVFEVPNASWVMDQWAGRKFVFKPGTQFEQIARIQNNTTDKLIFEQPVLLDIPFEIEKNGTLRQRTRNFENKDAAFKVLGSFDTDWVMRVPMIVHQHDVMRFWRNNRNVCGINYNEPCDPPAEPLDPYDPENKRSWADWVDRKAITDLIQGAYVPAFWGKPGDVDRSVNVSHEHERLYAGFTDPFIFFGSVILDLRHQGARTWQVRRTLSLARAIGLKEQDGLCIRIPYKPGIHNYHDEETLGVGRKSVANTYMDVGPARINPDGSAQDGTIARTQYGPGEFGAAANAYFRELIATAKHYGYSNIEILTEEGPQYRHPWYLLSRDVIYRPEMFGEAQYAPVNTPWPPPDFGQPLSKDEWPD